jgi:aminopeptidase YwaD
MTYEVDHDVIALPGTSSGDAEGELVDVSYGTSEAFAETDVGDRLSWHRARR